MNSSASNHAVGEPQEPAWKRAAAEAVKGGHSSQLRPAPHHRQPHDSTTQNARARFLRELEQYASDDEDEAVAVARSRGQGAVSSLAPSVQTQIVMIPTFPHASSSVPPPAPPVAADSAEFFFEHAAQHAHDSDPSDGDGDGSSSNILRQRNGLTTTAVHASTPSRIGLNLLHRMHAESTVENTDSGTNTSSNTSKAAKTNGQSASAAFEVVHAHVPLSTGGFLSTATAGADLMEGRQVRVGDVLSLRKLRSVTYPSSNASVTSFVNKTGNASTPAPPNSNETAPSSLSPSSFLSAEEAQKALRHFKSAEAFTDNEKDYGRRLPPDMVRLLFEVARVDVQGRCVEGLFLDGTRVKLPFCDVRPAGYDEQKRYAQWKADPASRPVTTMRSGASSPTSAWSPAGQPSSGEQAVKEDLIVADHWWVIPHLLVRIATEEAGDWYGKKCVVTAIRRSENTIRLAEWQDEAKSNSRPNRNAVETRELIGADGLETVVPTKGKRALIVLGPRKGEMCTVRSRVRGPSGELTAVEVEMSRTKEVMTFQAEELCALAR